LPCCNGRESAHLRREIFGAPRQGIAITVVARYHDYYRILGVARKATAEEIHRAFLRLARKHHPDLHPGDKKAEERFKEISEAYEVLGDRQKRRRYDSLGGDWKAGRVFTPPSGWRSRFGRGARRGQVKVATRGRSRFSDFFQTFFGRGRQEEFARAPDPVAAAPPKEEPPRGADIEAGITVSLEQLLRGDSIAVSVRVPDKEKGSSSRSTRRKYDVKIPPDIRDGARIRLAGQGRPAEKKNQPPGDLYIRVRIAPHPVFRPRGSDVEIELAVSPWEAALGGKIRVPALDETVEMTLPPGSQSGQRLRLRGKGLPKADGERGDQFVILKIMVPETLSNRERDLFEQLARDSSFNPRP